MNISTDSTSQFESRNRSNNADTDASTPSSSSDYITGDADDSSDSKVPIPCTLKSVENHLSLSKAMNQDDLQEMINKCKQMVLESAECSEERKWLVRRLIELRLRAQELRETSNEKFVETCVILGHHFSPQKYYIATTGSVYCDHCSGGIWTMLQSWYMCNDCGFNCHLKCMSSICRVCVHVIASEVGGYTYTKDICPERGLSAQGYRCAECNIRITFISKYIYKLQATSKGLSLSCFGSPFKYTESGSIEPKLCDYSGLYYCHRCHWNSSAVIPARVIRNWDIEPRKVSRAAFQLLTLMQNKPVLILENLNQKLFTLVPDLSLIKRLREELQMMKQYLVVCPDASNQGLPWKSGLRTHMLESSINYSVKDLIDLHSGVLMDEIQVAYDSMKNHITETCQLCRGRGHRCEICGNIEIIYPWDTTATTCQICKAVYHRLCRSKRNHSCPKCLRIQKRKDNNQVDTEIIKEEDEDNCDK
ncbi:differentially expressed in FDCP 8 homolog isoform X2 [Phymastichus coffea]|uniref:differentially expressed in FDCP 8 homolog isoform X2 n=1 Tax=Phymastichus coffea TaxID=108790 RepID=UPI00273C603D|nr:differentially expressed in FDCP 8 homolog isoform X2 [Phymastichus coffea]XP_058792985.1 differentially expressed in FDCP 8 homolog isoform X2 [Phymastichus coffea]